ncbi:MAG: aspartate/glutamate racemase family protein, partial [Pseudomonadota bacterium]
ATSGQFANAPVDVIVAACTGASYLIGAERERAIVDLVQAARGVPFLTAALAAVAALRARDAKRIALLSPYPETLNAASAPYWRSHGFDIVAVAGPQPRTDRFHPIYAVQSDMVLQTYRELSDAGADAVLMLGTGMPTLRPILQGADEGLTPAVSCNLALVWAAVQKKPWTDLAEGSIADWCRGVHWRERLDTLFPLPAGA